MPAIWFPGCSKDDNLLFVVSFPKIIFLITAVLMVLPLPPNCATLNKDKSRLLNGSKVNLLPNNIALITNLFLSSLLRESSKLYWPINLNILSLGVILYNLKPKMLVLV